MCVQWQGEEGTRQVLGTRVWGRRVWGRRVWGTRVWAPAHEGVVVIVPSLAAVEEGNPPVVCSQASWLCHKMRVQEACVRSVCKKRVQLGAAKHAAYKRSMLATSGATCLSHASTAPERHAGSEREAGAPEHQSTRQGHASCERARRTARRESARRTASEQTEPTPMTRPQTISSLHEGANN